MPVAIDIKPGSPLNPINLASRGVIPVAVLTTSKAQGDTMDFDALAIDPASISFGPGNAAISHSDGHAEDADGDGFSLAFFNPRYRPYLQ